MHVKIFTKRACPYSHLAKKHLEEKGIPFEEVSVEDDPIAANETIKLSGQTGVPVIVLDHGRVIVGWNKAAIDEIFP